MRAQEPESEAKGLTGSQIIWFHSIRIDFTKMVVDFLNNYSVLLMASMKPGVG